MARVAQALAVSWNCANDAVLGEGHRMLIPDPARFDGVTTIGVDEHAGGTPAPAIGSSPSSST